MFIYAKTYENTKKKNYNFPTEDSFWYSNSCAIVCDGVTRDPVEDLSSITPDEFMSLYPRPSGAEIASKAICEEFSELSSSQIPLEQILMKANQRIKQINDKKISKCDYLINDYYAAVVSCIKINNNILEYSYLCDCGIIIFDRDGKIKFQTNDDMSEVDKYFDTNGIPWNKPQARVIIRRDYRNKPDNKYSYGAITGEDEVEHYIKTGKILLDEGDYIMLYSDGFLNYFARTDFFEHISNFNNIIFDDYVKNIAFSDYDKYGKEKTLIIFRYE